MFSRLIALIEQAAFISPPVPWEVIMRDLEEIENGIVVESLSPAKLEILSQQTGYTLEQITEISKVDPTPNGACTSWLVRHVKAENIRLPEDGDSIKQNLTAFIQLKNKSTYDGEKDLNKLEPGDLWDLVQKYQGLQGKKEKLKVSAEQGVKLLGQDGPCEVFEVTTAEAGAKLWRQTNWCVRSPNMFGSYGIPYFYVTKNGEPFLLYHEKSKQFKTPNDKEVALKTAYQAFGALKASGILLDQRTAMKSLMGVNERNRVFTVLSMLQTISPEDLQDYLNDLGLGISAVQHEFKFTKKSALVLGIDKWFEFLKEAKEFPPSNMTGWNALWSMKGFEERMLQTLSETADATWLDGFVRPLPLSDVPNLVEPIKGAIERLLPASLPTAMYKLYYLQGGNGRWPAIEPHLLADPGYRATACVDHVQQGIVAYASRLKNRWFEFEVELPTIVAGASSGQAEYFANAGFRYAVDVLKTRWPSLENIITPKFSSKIINIAGGDYSASTPYLKLYKDETGVMWPAAEKITLWRPEGNLSHFEQVLGQPWPEGRQALLTRTRSVVSDPRSGDHNLSILFDELALLKVEGGAILAEPWIRRNTDVREATPALKYITKYRTYFIPALKPLILEYWIGMVRTGLYGRVTLSQIADALPLVLDLLYKNIPKLPKTVRETVLNGMLYHPSYAEADPAFKEQSSPEFAAAKQYWASTS